MKETKTTTLQQLFEEFQQAKTKEKEVLTEKVTLEGSVDVEKVNIAILIGMSEYKNLIKLPQCKNDVSLMKTIIQEVKKISNHDILYIEGESNGREATDKIIAFINSFTDRKLKVDEIFFYFSGHGSSHKSTNGDFESRYLFTDFDDTRVNETSIAANYIDGLIRKLSPNTYVKIIDSCYSGSRLIKTPAGQSEQFVKGVSYDEEHYKNEGFNNVYVMASSSEDQVSYANTKFSDFSESFFLALQELEGDIKYRHIINRLADAFSNKEQRPSFVTQGPLDGGFGLIKDTIKTSILNALMEDHAAPPEKKQKEVSRDLSSLSKELIGITKSKTFTQDEFNQFLEKVSVMIEEIKSFSAPIFDSILDSNENQKIPNSKAIGEWIASNRNDFFARATYSKKESSTISSTWESLLGKYRKEVDGFSFVNTEEEKSRVKLLNLTPKENMKVMDSISTCIVVINSAERIFVFQSNDKNKLSYWDMYENPKFSTWKITEITEIKNNSKTSDEIKIIKDSIIDFITDNIMAKITEKST